MRLTIWDILSIILLLALILVGVIVVQIFIDPYSSVNPFPPATMPAPIQLPTSTNTPRVLPPTWTPTALTSGQATLRPSSTLPPTATSFLVPTATATPTPTRTPTLTPTVTQTPTETLVPTRTNSPMPTATTEAPTSIP